MVSSLEEVVNDEEHHLLFDHFLLIFRVDNLECLEKV